jgi:hypothetical protein
MILRAFLSEQALETVANYWSERWGTGAQKSRPGRPPPIRSVGKPGFARLARARKRHYTFARLVFAALSGRTGKVNKPFQGIDSLVKFR